MTKQEIILRLVESLNRGDSGGAYVRVGYAVRQYEQMVACGIIKEDEE
jgi:hypothetical protein